MIIYNPEYTVSLGSLALTRKIKPGLTLGHLAEILLLAGSCQFDGASNITRKPYKPTSWLLFKKHDVYYCFL